MRSLVYALLFFATVGFLDAGYLYAARILNLDLSCSILEGCNIVAASAHSVLFGVPLALFGVIFYGAVIALAFRLIAADSLLVRRLLVAATSLGLAASAYFIYVQAFFIGAFCIYCVISAIIALTLWLISLAVLFSGRRMEEAPSVNP